MFQKASKGRRKLRMAICGPSGSGKSYSAFRVGAAIAHAEGKGMGVIDTEEGSASLYADQFSFDVAELQDYHPRKYIEMIKLAADYGVLVVDSLSHAWLWELNQVDNFSKWKDVRPLERSLIQSLLTFPGHVIVTMRSKTEWVLNEIVNNRGKTVKAPEKVGTSPVQASRIEYEFDISGEIDLAHNLRLSKTRCPKLDGQIISFPDEAFALQMLSWLNVSDPTVVVSPVPRETGEQRCHRVKAAREAAGILTEQVKAIIQRQFDVVNPKQQSPNALTTEQCDQLIFLIQQQAEQQVSQSVTVSLQPITQPLSLDDGLDTRSAPPHVA